MTRRMIGPGWVREDKEEAAQVNGIHWDASGCSGGFGYADVD